MPFFLTLVKGIKNSSEILLIHSLKKKTSTSYYLNYGYEDRLSIKFQKIQVQSIAWITHVTCKSL